MPALSTPFISVIIPTFNYARYLPRAIDSVLSQKGQDYEIVVVDDGSTDHAGEVVKGYESRTRHNILYHAFSENRGPAAARNYGVKLSSGQYILFLDADDALQPDALDLFCATVGQEPTPDFVWGGHVQLNLDGTAERGYPPPLFRDKHQNVLRYLRTGPGLMNVGTLLIRRTVFDRIRWPEHTRIWADVVFNSHLLALFNGVSIHDPVLTIYKHADSLQYNIQLVGRDRLKTVDLLFDPTVLPAELMAIRNEYLDLVWISLMNFLTDCLKATGGRVKKEYLSAVESFFRQVASPARLFPSGHKGVGEACFRLFRHLYREGHYKEARAVYRWCLGMFPRQGLQFRHLGRYARLLISTALRKATAPSKK